MFSRAAKSLVKSISQRKYHAGEENIKLAMIGGVGEIGRSLSQMLKQSSKLDVLALYDVAASNKRFSTQFKPKGFADGETINSANSRMLTMLGKTQSNNKGDHRTEELVESLRRLPIAEECSKPNAPQGDNGIASESEGPRVLAEMGPATFRHGGRIVSEIYKQFPDFATYLGKNRRNNTSNTTSTRRRYSNIALFSNECLTSIGNDLQFGKTLPDFVVYPNKLSGKNVPAEKADRKCHSKKKEARKQNAVSPEQIIEKKSSKLCENRSTTTQKCDKKKTRVKRLNEPKIVNEVTAKCDRRSSNFGKSKNWTIPAALSDKKPKMLYGLVHQRRRSLTNFFTRFFDIPNKEASDDRHGGRYAGCKMDKFNCVQNQKLFKELNEGGKSCTTTNNREDRLNASTSTGDLSPESLQVPEDDSKSLNQTAEVISLERFDGTSESIEERVLTSSNEESENDAISEINEPQTPLQKMSSKIALFLENLRIKRRKSASLSSLASYNLDALFSDQEAVPVSNYVTTNSPFLLSSSDSDSFASRIRKKICRKKRKKDKQDDVCKKRRSPCQPKETECRRSEASKICQRKKECGRRRDECGRGRDECGKEKRRSSCGESEAPRSTCGQRKQEISCKKRDEGEKNKCRSSCKDSETKSCGRKRKDDCEKNKCRSSCKDSETKSCGRKKKEPSCGKGESDRSTCRSSCGTTEEDPCKPYRQDKHQGAPCKKHEEDETYGKKDDPCGKFRRDDLHGKPCKDEDPCKKFRTPDIHGKPCKTYRDEIGRGDPCGKFWKDDVHGSRCDKGKKKEPECCGYSKEEKVTDLKKKKQLAKKKKIEAAETLEKNDKEKCPPVIRAPGCPKGGDSGKSGGDGGKSGDDGGKSGGSGDSSCRKYSTLAWNVHAVSSDFVYRTRTRKIFESSHFDDF